MAILKEDEARQALRLYVGDHFCFGKGPVEELTFIELQTSSAFHVRKYSANMSIICVPHLVYC